MSKKQRRREVKGTRIFIVFSFVVMCVGIVMVIFEQSATGHFANRGGTSGKIRSISGLGVMAMGIFMLLLLLWFFPWSSHKTSRKSD